MEDALALVKNKFKNLKIQKKSINPCCNGRCTRTIKEFFEKFNLSTVLILVVMEDALALYKTVSQKVD